MNTTLTKRHRDAILCSDGACNPRAIINGMAQALTEMVDGNGHYLDTPTVCSDPALKLMTHQLCYLLGIPTCESPEAWALWRRACGVSA